MINRIVLVGLLISSLSHATPLANRPLRKLKVGSTISISSELRNLRDTYFQKGKIAAGSFDPETSYCHINLNWKENTIENLFPIATISQIEGSFTSFLGKAGLTTLSFQGPEVVGSIQCKFAGKSVFTETSFSSFEEVFGNNVEWDSILTDAESHSRDLIPLSAEVLQEKIGVEILRKFPHVEAGQNNERKWYIQNKDFVARPNFDKPYCLLGSTNDVEKALNEKTELRLANISGGYMKNGIIHNSVYFVGDALQKNLRVYCSAPGSEFPTYSQVVAATESVLAWVYHP